MTIQTETPAANPKEYLADLQRLQREVQDDLRERTGTVADLKSRLESEWDAARQAGRTSSTYEAWREDYLVQSAAAWIVACVFARYLEDHGLIEQVWLAGEPAGPEGGEDRLRRAQDSHEAYFRVHPGHSDREYLEHVFLELARLPGCADLFAEDRNPLWKIGVSGDMGRRLLTFFQERNPETGRLLRPFTTAEGDTRFLGDLYQDLSEDARKRYALLQTPDFVEEFILDRTLEPAIREFGLEEVRLLDPACGSGHFLLGGFHRLFRRWQEKEPGGNRREWARRAVEAVAGVDLNPFAAAIARFRLLVAYLRAAGIAHMKDAPDVKLRVAAGDSLIYEQRLEYRTDRYLEGESWTPDSFMQGDYEDACEILRQRYHAVVGNPPYITDKDPVHREFVREHYASAAGKFSLGVPFTERFFELAVQGGRGTSAGWVGMITTNSFMKREFGSKLISEFFPKVDLTHVLDTSGAYLPGHGTPTVILVGRHRSPVDRNVRAALGVRGEPQTPEDPSQGKVWRSIVDLVDQPGAESEYITIADVPRGTFHKHPWSLEGGGAGELKELVEGASNKILEDLSDSIGFASFTGQDEVFAAEEHQLLRMGLPKSHVKSFIFGEAVRDWQTARLLHAFSPYDCSLGLLPLDLGSLWYRFLWPYRRSLQTILTFGNQTRMEAGDPWWAWYRWVPEKYRTPLSIAFAFVATHNHFVLDRGGKVFKQSAPVIKLPPGATEDEHLALLGVLNSSVANFWARQTLYAKGGDYVGTEGARLVKTPWDDRLERDGTKIATFPLARERETIPLARLLDSLSIQAQSLLPASLVTHDVPTRAALDAARTEEDHLFGLRVALQEELDWLCYRLYGILTEAQTPLFDPEQVPEVRLGERAFEIVMARKMAAVSSPPPGGPGGAQFQTTWFERHGSTPITEIPSRWPAEYQAIVQRRIDLIEAGGYLRLLEKPEHKRRWNRERWEDLEQAALRSWLLDRLETPRYWPAQELTSCARLADMAGQDPEFLQVAAQYMGVRAGTAQMGGRSDYDRTALVTELVLSEAVPHLPVLRYKPSGLLKRKQWEDVWALQRREDAASGRSPGGAGGSTDLVGDIPVPPKYTSADFLDATFWRLRGKLDVPKERFVHYPHAERETDPTPVVAWAGWDHLEQAKALAAYYLRGREVEGFPVERLVPLLAGLQELLPWVLQWHPEVDPGMGMSMGEFFRMFLAEQLRALGLKEEDLRNWTPPARTTRGRQKK